MLRKFKNINHVTVFHTDPGPIEDVEQLVWDARHQRFIRSDYYNLRNDETLANVKSSYMQYWKSVINK